MWLQFLELGYPPTTPTIVHEDNKSAITIISNGNDKGRTKYGHSLPLRPAISPTKRSFCHLLSIYSYDS